MKMNLRQYNSDKITSLAFINVPITIPEKFGYED